MTQRTQISTTIDPVIKALLQRMCRADLLTIRNQLERLIREEHARRNERQRRGAIVNHHYPDAAPDPQLPPGADGFRTDASGRRLPYVSTEKETA